MVDIDRKIDQQLRSELDDVLFANMELNEQVKQQIRRQANGTQPVRRFTAKRAWSMTAASVAVAAMLIAIVFTMLQQPAVQNPAGNNGIGSVPPVEEGVSGSEFSQLVTIPLSTPEDAKAAFGPELLLPSFVPDGYTLKEIVSVGMPGEPVRDIIMTYAAGEKSLTFAASRMAPSYPADLFSKVKVGSAEGAMFEQTELTELFWTVEDVHYSITGNVSGEEAVKLAEAVQ
ncbi:hypothetical protein [Paenibacillus silvisoli]|uniref:hypothetical protein n=1 Tax=Paenibacillus silvisoli TaxID=3110539 RepID=UPI002803CCA0|nr:hypothetical protein [Paenibacillus silvisoli]